MAKIYPFLACVVCIYIGCMYIYIFKAQESKLGGSGNAWANFPYLGKAACPLGYRKFPKDIGSFWGKKPKTETTGKNQTQTGHLC